MATSSTLTRRRGSPGRPAPERAGRRSRWRAPLRWDRGRLLGLAAGGLTFAALVARNTYLFRTPVRPLGDAAVDSILVDQAERFRLLVGNYSRLRFHHPGPALLYVGAAGQAFFHGLLHVVPGPYNGELLGWFALAAALVGLSVRIAYRHQRSSVLCLVGLAVTLAWLGERYLMASSWFPDLYVAPFLLFAIAGASIGMGSVEDLPAFVLAGGLLVQGHVAFIEFVGVGTLVAGAVMVAALRRRPGRVPRGPLLLAGGLAALFALPMVLEVVLHYPGYWPDYLRYAEHHHVHSISSAVGYASQFWPAGLPARVGLGLLTAAAGWQAWRRRSEPAGRFALGLLAAAALTVLLLVAYAVRGIDDLRKPYIGLFSISAPVLVLLAAVSALGAPFLTAVSGRLRGRAGRGLAIAALAGTLAVLAVEPGYASADQGAPGLPRLVAAARTATGGKAPVPLRFPAAGWSWAAGFVVQAREEGYPVCVASRGWLFMFTSADVCTAREKSAARSTLVLENPGDRTGRPVGRAGSFELRVLGVSRTGPRRP